MKRRRPPRLEPRDRVWISRMRQLEAQAESDDVEDAEFADHPNLPVRALTRHERALAAPVVREIVRERESSSWMPIAVGLGVIAIVGLAGVVVYLLLRRDGDKVTTLGAVDPRLLPQLPAPQPAPQIYVINTGGGSVTAPAPTPELAAPPPQLKPVAYPTREPMMHRLPATEAVPLAGGGAHTIEVDVGVTEGGTALLGFSADLTTAISMRVGERRRIRIERHRMLYGKGESGPVMITIQSTS